MEMIKLVFTILGFIALLIYGIHLLSNSLEQYHNQFLSNILSKLTSSPTKSVLVGIIISTITQSSNATTIILLGLLAAKLVSLKSAVAVMLGANIGTCFTTLFIGFDLKLTFPAIISGVIIYMTTKKKVKYLGLSILGVGLIYLSINSIEAQLITFIQHDFVIKCLALAERNSLFGMLSGLIVSVFLQSSAATISLGQSMVGTESISLTLGIAIMLGANIGTTCTGLLASSTLDKDAKTLAISQVWLNLIGALLVLPILDIYIKFSTSIFPSVSDKIMVSISHLLFNLLSTIVALIFINHLIKLSSIGLKRD